MNKKEAIEKMVAEMSNISQDQFTTLMEAQEEYYPLPMWGTMWRMDYFGEDLYNNARVMASCPNDVNVPKDADSIVTEMIETAKHNNDWNTLQDYIDEEMAGARCVLDNEGNATAMYVYELDGEYWMGVNGAGWNFYYGVWDKLYDICGLQWHDDCPEVPSHIIEYLIQEAWTLLEIREDEHAEAWRSYAEQHAKRYVK